MAPPAMAKDTITRQLAPTVGPAASGVTFRAGILSGIGNTIMVGSLEFDGNVGHFINTDTYMPAQNHLVSSCVLPIGSANIFIGLTEEAMGFRGGSKFIPPALSPVEDGYDAGFGIDLPYSYVGADQDLLNAYRQSPSGCGITQKMPMPRSHFVGMVQIEPAEETETDQPVEKAVKPRRMWKT